MFSVLEIKAKEGLLKSTSNHGKVTIKDHRRVNINVFCENNYILESKKISEKSDIILHFCKSIMSV